MPSTCDCHKVLVMRLTPAPDLVWPSALFLPAPIKLVYFDTLVWRGLAEAAYGRIRNDSYSRLLDECHEAVARRAAFFPVSKEFLIEINKYEGLEGRMRVARTVAEIGRLRSLASRFAIRRLELEDTLTALIGPPRVELGPYHMIGRTLLHAFQQEIVMLRWDRPTNACLNDTFEAKNEEIIREIDRLGGDFELQMTMLCSGNPGGVLTEDSDTALAREAHIARQLDRDDKRRTGDRLRDVFLASELVHGLNEADLDYAFETRGTSLIEWLTQSDRKLGKTLVRGMPSCEVSSELRTRYHRTASTKFKQNHINDIGFLSVAVPYCDAVFTDRAVRNMLKAAQLDRRMNTKLLESPSDAADFLAALPGLDNKGTWRLPGSNTKLPDSELAKMPDLSYYFEVWDDGS